MSNLESIVPPLELCKQIPEGCFEDSALVWTFDDRLMPRIIMIDGVRHYYNCSINHVENVGEDHVYCILRDGKMAIEEIIERGGGEMRKISLKVWNQYIEGRGFFQGYTQIGLDMLRVAVNDPRVIRTVMRRKENQQRFNREYYLRNKYKLREYHMEYNRRYREKINSKSIAKEAGLNG